MQAVATIGLDIAKSVFLVHGIDAEGKVLVRCRLKRRYVLTLFEKLPACVIGIKACACAHHWSRELQALGHIVRLMPPAYVKPYVKRHKNDATDSGSLYRAAMGGLVAAAHELKDKGTFSYVDTALPSAELARFMRG